jgi:hypothetical protein
MRSFLQVKYIEVYLWLGEFPYVSVRIVIIIGPEFNAETLTNYILARPLQSPVFFEARLRFKLTCGYHCMEKKKVLQLVKDPSSR